MVPWFLVGGGLLALFAASRIRAPLPPELASLAITSSGLPNTPPPEVWPNLRRLARFLEGFSARSGPVRIHSGFRSPEVNAAAGGVSSSLHMQGRAVDFSVPGDPAAVQRIFQEWAAEPFRIAGLIEEAILYHYQGSAPWIHVGLAPAGLAPSPRLKRVTRSGGQTV